MTFNEIKQQLVDNNLENYIEVFEQNHLFDIDILQSMTNEDYLSIGISIIGDRKKLLSIFAKEKIIPNSQKIFLIEKDFGEKIYKEVTISGKKVQRWCILNSIEKFDANKNLIYRKNMGREEWNDYNLEGKIILSKYNTLKGKSFKIFYEYDSYGNIILEKNEVFEEWRKNKYKYDKNGNIIYCESKGGDYNYEYFYEYDSEGRVIREYSINLDKKDKNKDDEIWNEYDENGNIIHSIWVSYDSANQKKEIWNVYDKNTIISKKCIKEDQYRNKHSKEIENIIYEYNENGNCIYELSERNFYENAEKIDSKKIEIFYEYLKDGDVYVKYQYTAK